MYNLARFPEVQEKVYQEIESILGKDNDVTPSHLAKLRYLKACLKESMRYNKRDFTYTTGAHQWAPVTQPYLIQSK